MNALPAPPPLPRSIKRMTVLCLVLSALVGYASLSEALHLGQLDQVQDQLLSGQTAIAPEMKEITQAALEAQIRGLKAMKGSRQLLLGLLWVASTVTLVGAARLLRPAAFSRDGLLRLVGRGCLAVAALRTMEGAQMAALGRRMGQAAEKAALGHPAFAEAPPGMVTGAFVAAFVLLTLLMAGGFLGLSLYFRSEKTLQRVALPRVEAD